MEDREPTIRSRQLGEGLRRAMAYAGMNGKMTAEALGWSESRVSRVLLGKRSVKELDVAAFLGACHIVGDEREWLLELCRNQDKHGWWQQFGDRLPKELITYIEHEDEANRLDVFQALTMPGLLQTTDYAFALMRGGGRIPEEEIYDRVVARSARRVVFDKPSAEFNFFIHEFVLRLPVGGREVMSEQLHELLRMAVRPQISIRVIPAKAGSHAGTAGSFILMEFPVYQPIAFSEHETSCVFMEDPVETAAYRQVLDRLDAAALSVSDSREMIASLAMVLYSSEEGVHDEGPRLA